MYDVIIVGAGPVGCEVASIVAKEGYDVLIAEEHREIGKPVQCAGLVSTRVLELTGLKNIILNKINGAQFHSPNEQKLSVNSSNTKAYVIDRGEFDKGIAKKAVNNGVQIALGKKVNNIKRNKYITIKIGEKTEKSKLLIGADGANSNIRKIFNFPKPKKILIGIQKEVTGLNFDKSLIYTYLGNEIAPNFFAWVIPSEDTFLIGLCIEGTKKTAFEYLENFCKRFNNVKTIKYMSGQIPIGMLNQTFDDNIMLVGDAACQVKPISGGGLFTGLICAEECAKTAIKALKMGDFSKRLLSQYQINWQRKIGKEIKNGMRLRKILYNFCENDVEKLFNILDNPKLLKIVAEKGDIDYPSKLIFPVFKKSPVLIKFAPQALNSLI